jgi:hypothetical protein
VDVVHASARRISNVRPASRTRLHNFDRTRKNDTLRATLDLGAHAFARDRAGDEHDHPIVAREHSPAGHGTFDVKV